jgi:hypothetical protein
MKTLILKIMPLWFLVMLTSVSPGQTIVTTAGTVTSCPGEIQVPLDVTNCNGVGAISLTLFFNNTALSFIGYQNPNAALTGGTLVVNGSGNKVAISWINYTTAANIGNGTLLKLRFTSNTYGSSNFTWDTQTPGNCEYGNLSGTILPSSYVNGTANINQPPLILSNPANQTALVGQTPSFTMSASGAGLAYQWQGSSDNGNTWADLTNSASYSNVTSPTLYVTNVQLALNGYKYKCRVTGTCTPMVYTNAAGLTVINPITTSLPVAGFCPGKLTVPVAVTNFNGVASFSLTFSYNPSILTYTGDSARNPALSGGTFVTNAVGGKIYMSWYSTAPVSFGNGTIIILKFNGITGSSSLTWDVGTPGNCEYSDINGTRYTTVFNNGTETIHALPAVTGNPVNSTIAKGQNTSFTVTASGTGLSYQWQVSTNNGASWTDLTNGAPYSNVTGATLYINGTQLALSGNRYQCRVSGTCPPAVYSGSATLIVLPNIITTCGTVSNCPGAFNVPVNVTDFIGVGSFSLVVNYNPAILTYTGYQDLNPALTGGVFINNFTAGKIYLSWYNYTTGATISTGGLLINLKFNGITGASSLNWDLQTQGACEYSDLNGLIIFSTWNNGNATIHQLPAITSQPANTSNYSGGNAYFSVGASGTGLAYLWQKSTDGTIWTNLPNTAPYSGTTTATVSIMPATTPLNGTLYKCIVSGTCAPSVTSAPALLTVNAAPITTVPGTITNSCTGNLYIPLNVTNCNNVGGISLTLVYDTTKLTYDGYQGVNSSLASGILVVNRNKNKVIMSWASSTPANIGTGSLITCRFKATTAISTTLGWDTQTPGSCEYSDINGTIITSFYNTSSVSVAANPLLANAGTDIIMTYPPVQLNGSATGGVTPYTTWLWSPSTWLTNASIANPIAAPHFTTDYVLSVTGSNGCIALDPVTVKVVISPTLSLQNLTVGNGVTYCYNATQIITVAGGATTFTVQNGGSATLIAGQKISFLPGTTVLSGGYMHGYITTNGQFCYGNLPSMLLTGTQETETVLPAAADHLFSVYPNPTSGEFILDFPGENKAINGYAELLGMRGEKIEGKVLTGNGTFGFNLSGKPAGLYFIRVISGNRSETGKIIKY